MCIVERNQKAIQALEVHDYSLAQLCFFENAKKFPCHETLNNLGYYLITEGLQCKNNNIRNSHSLGLKYLLQSAELKKTPINLCAIAASIHYSIEKRHKNYLGISTYQNAYIALEHAAKLQYTDETEYNRLRFLYLCDMQNIEVLDGMKQLIETFISPDSVYFYLFLLCLHHQYDECRRMIESHYSMLDEVDLMTFYCICGEYQKGAALFDKIHKHFCLDQTRTVMLVECLLRSNMEGQIEQYEAAVVEHAQEIRGAFPWMFSCENLIFDTTSEAQNYRQKVISDFRIVPAYLHQCCYFGCHKHGTPGLIDTNNSKPQ